MQFIALYCAIIIYSLFSSPTPDIIGWAEYTVIALLLISIGVMRPLYAITASGLSLYLSYHRLFWVFLLSVPTIIGLVNGHAILDIARDFIPAAILILPLCFYRNVVDGLPIAMTIAGGIFAIRYLLPSLPIIDFLPHNKETLLYLANAPLVSFAAIMGFYWLSDNDFNVGIIQRLGGFIICALCFLAMGMMLQRAPLILCAAACFIILAVRLTQRPLQSIIIAAVIAACIYPFLPIFIEIFSSLHSKTLNVGWNSRIEEFQTVLEQAKLFGHGWGSEMQSPAVADIWVRFTHNFISYMIFKTGMVGGIVAIGFASLWIWQNIKLIRYDIALGLAIFIPLIIHLTLYTGFKTLDFALLLTLLSVLCAQKKSS